MGMLAWGMSLESESRQLTPDAEGSSSAPFSPATCSTERADLWACQLQLVIAGQLRSTIRVRGGLVPCNAAAKHWRPHQPLCKLIVDACHRQPSHVS